LTTKKQIATNKSSLKEKAYYYFETDNRKNESEQLRHKSLNLLDKESSNNHDGGEERIIDLRMCNNSQTPLLTQEDTTDKHTLADYIAVQDFFDVDKSSDFKPCPDNRLAPLSKWDKLRRKNEEPLKMPMNTLKLQDKRLWMLSKHLVTKLSRQYSADESTINMDYSTSMVGRGFDNTPGGKSDRSKKEPFKKQNSKELSSTKKSNLMNWPTFRTANQVEHVQKSARSIKEFDSTTLKTSA